MKGSVVVKRTAGPSYVGETLSGTVRFEGSDASPMDTLAASLGGCLAITISSILQTMRQPLNDIEVRLTYEKQEERPRVFVHFKVDLVLRGEKLSHERVERAVQLAEEIYCPVSVMLQRAGVKIDTSFTLE